MRKQAKVCGAAAATTMWAAMAASSPTGASGAVSVSIANVSVSAGQTAMVGVFVSSNSGDVISGFNLPLDVNANGFVDANNDGVGDLPAGFAYAAPPVAMVVYGNTALDMPQLQITLINVDAIPTGSGANITLTAAPTRLFNLAVTVASSVPVGTVVPLDIIVPADPFGPLFNVAGPANPTVVAPTQGSPVFGSIRVVGVPEPTTAVGAVAVVALGGRRRRPVRTTPPRRV